MEEAGGEAVHEVERDGGKEERHGRHQSSVEGGRCGDATADQVAASERVREVTKEVRHSAIGR